MNAVGEGSSFTGRHPRAGAFAVLCLLTVGSALVTTDPALYGDGEHYWRIARSFSTEHGFAFDGYTDHLRGYLFPLLLHAVQQAAGALHVEPLAGFRIISAVMGAALFAAALPTALAHLFAVRLTAARTLSFAVVCFVYWRGHLLHPLSDLPALLFLTVGVLSLPGPNDRDWPCRRALVAGGCLAAAANVRPINEAALAGAIILVGWSVVRAASRRKAALAAIIFALGVGLVAAPQAATNGRTLGTRNPFAHPSMSPIAPNLYLQQLVWGASIQRYETNIGGTFPVSVIFADRRGQELLGLDLRYDPRNFAHEAQSSVRAYLRLVSRAPWFFASAYGRHLFNGLDVAYSTPYVERLTPRSAPFALVNYLMLGLAVVWGLGRLGQLRLGPDASRLWLTGIYALPALLAIPTAIECRFLMPLWTLAYGFVIFHENGSSVTSQRRVGQLLLWLVVAVALSFLLATSTYGHIQGAPESYETWCIWCWA